MAFRFISRTRLFLIGAIASGALLQSCIGDDGDSPAGPDGIGTDDKDTGVVITLFTGTHPVDEATQWTFESGTSKSATGKLNPDVFAEGKSPLRSKGARLKLNLFEGTSFTAVIDSSQLIGPNRYTAFGYLRSIPGSSFIATCEGEMLSALVIVPETGVFRVEFAGNGTYRAVLQNGHAPSCPPTPVPKVKLDTTSAPAPLRKAAAAGPVVIDIAILYTAAAVTGARGLAAMNTLADQAVAQANEAYRNSLINVSLNIVHRGQVNYTESGNIQTDLTRLQSTNDAYLAEAHTLRDTYGADVVTLITETGEANIGGLGYVMTAVNPAYNAYAFNVVRRQYASGYSVLAHEVGHNMGCMHDPANSSNAGAFAYSYGHRWNGTGGVQYRDLMAYAPGTSINYFSNPAVAYKGGATGVAGSANTALTITNTMATLEAYRASKVPTVALTSPIAGTLLGAPANVILNATAGGSAAIARVEFYNDTTLLGTDLAAPYSFAWSPVAAGTYKVSAKAYTKTGVSVTSAPVTFKTEKFGYGGVSSLLVGTTGISGAASYVPNGTDPIFTVTGTGLGIKAKADNFQFLHHDPQTGDVTLRGRIDSIRSDEPEAMAGFMIRENLTPGSKCVFIGRNPAGELIFIKRTAAGGAASAKKLPSAIKPTSLQLIRKGNDFAVYRSDDRRNWSFVVAQTISMTSVTYSGAAVFSNSSTVSNTAVFGLLEYETRQPANFPPFVSIANPVSGSSFNAGTTLTFAATATDRDGAATIKEVQYFNDAASQPEEHNTGFLGSDKAAPYTLSWKSIPGIAQIKAKVIDGIFYSSYSNTLVLDIKGPGSWVANPLADLHVRNGTYSASKYGATATLMVRNTAVDGDLFEGYLKFRIDSLATIAHATLRLYGNVMGGTEAVTVAVHGVDSLGWMESGTKTVSWNTKPPAGSRIVTGTVSGSALQWHEFDLSAYVKARRAAGAVMVAFNLQGVDPTASYANFNSRTAKTGFPELIISKN